MAGLVLVGQIFFHLKLMWTQYSPPRNYAHKKFMFSVHDSDKKQEKKSTANAYQVRAAVATAIGLAAARAKMLADQEEREMELLMASIIETQVKSL